MAFFYSDKMSDFRRNKIRVGDYIMNKVKNKKNEKNQEKQEILTLFSNVEGFEKCQEAFLALPPKRIRYDTPTYLKFYTVYQYDRLKFRELMNEWLKTEGGKDENRTLAALLKKQREVLEVCYIRDEQGKKIRDSDEKHIYRYITLWNIRRAILIELNFKKMAALAKSGQDIIVNGEVIAIDYVGEQAGLKDTEDMSLGDRVKAHIKLLRRLRNDI